MHQATLTYRAINHAVFNKIQQFSHTNWALFLLAVWSFLEAGIWFIFPDFLLMLLVFFNKERWKRFLAVTYLFSMMGIITYFILVSQYPIYAESVLKATPFVNPLTIEVVQAHFLQSGEMAAIFQPLTPYPSKVWSFSAATMGMGLILYLGFVGAARLVRMFLLSWLAIAFHRFLAEPIKNHMLPFLIVYIILNMNILYFLGN